MEDRSNLSKDKVKETTLVFRSDTFLFLGAAEDVSSRAGTFQLEVKKTPEEVDFTSTNKEVMLGIYSLGKDGYKIGFAPVDCPHPTSFSSTSENDNILHSWARQKQP